MSDTQNPDFRGSASDVETPSNIKELCGWTSNYDDESREADKLIERMPRFCQEAPGSQQFLPSRWKAFDDFQKSKGRYEGSADWSLIDEWVLGKRLDWLPQIVGSCVISNTLRPWVASMMVQVAVKGEPEMYFGGNEFGPDNFSFYGPFSYGDARVLGNMHRGGDGLYCQVARQSFIETGVILCSNPDLHAICDRNGTGGDRDYPEPQSARVYRQWGAGNHIRDLKRQAGFNLVEAPMIKSADQLWDLLGKGKTAFVCSMEAIHRVGRHRDGFSIHARNPGDQWAHNMSVQGRLVASDGERFFVWSNESWGKSHVYYRKFDEVADSFRRNRLTMCGIGDILAPSSPPPSVEL